MVTKLTRILLGAILMLGTVGIASADCGSRIRHDQRRVDHAVEHFGYHSPEAWHARQGLRRDEAECNNPGFHIGIGW